MNYTTVYVGMDTHKDSFSLCCYTNEKEKAEYFQKVDGHYSKVLNYLDAMRFHYGDDAVFVCGYEAGCLGFTLFHQLTVHHVTCVILAPTSMSVPAGRKKIKTDKRDAAIIARCLAHHDYNPVHVPTELDEQTKEYIRMRDDHKLAFKKVKQQILAFCLRHGLRYEGQNWSQKHLAWLHAQKPAGLYSELLGEYLATYEMIDDKIKRFDKRIQELANTEPYHENVHKLECLIGIKAHTALSVIVETGDFHRFATAGQYSSYLGLTPGEDSSGDDRTRLGITKAGNRHIRTLLIESAQCYGRGRVGYKSKELKDRQYGNSPEVIAYADKGNERLRRRYYKMVLSNGKKHNVAKTAIARELACFIWGMMTDHLS